MRRYFQDSFFLDGEGVFRDLTGEVVTVGKQSLAGYENAIEAL